MHYPEQIKTYGPLGLRAALHTAAEQEGQTFTEFLRDLLQQEVGRRGIEIVPTFSTQPLKRLRRATAQ